MRLPLPLAFLIHDLLGIVGLSLVARDTYIGEGLSVTRYSIARRPRWQD